MITSASIVAEKHGGQTDAGNLALFNPRQERWPDHFRLVGSRVEPVIPVGRVTLRLLQFNHPERIQERSLLLLAGLLASP